MKLQETATTEKDVKRRLREFKKTLENNEVLHEFDRHVFESIVTNDNVKDLCSYTSTNTRRMYKFNFYNRLTRYKNFLVNRE